MCRFIGMEDVVANALIELIDSKGCRRVNTKQIMEYGVLIVRYLMKNGEQAVLLISRDYTSEFIYNYSDFFEISVQGNDEYISLKDSKTVEDLRACFRACISPDYLEAFISEQSLAVLIGVN